MTKSATRLRIFSWIGILWGAFILVTAGPRGQYFAIAVGVLMLFAGITTLRKLGFSSAGFDAHEFARRYTSAWCSQQPDQVAEFFATHGALTINRGTPSVGRQAIAASARGFMTAFPDMVVTFDRLVEAQDEDTGRATYHWTLTGTNSGPGGTGRRVQISGREEWLFDSDGLILDSQGHFDEADYARQLNG